MSGKNILYFSNHCQLSQNLIVSMQRERLLEFFYTICVDNNPNYEGRITTPTIVMAKYAVPYSGAETFVWLSKIKEWKSQQQIQRMGDNQTVYLGTALAAKKKNILGFNAAEMNSLSDMFAFFATDINQECHKALPQSYVDYQEAQNQPIFVAPEMMDENERKIKPKEQIELVSRLKRERQQQSDIFSKKIEEFRNRCNDA